MYRYAVSYLRGRDEAWVARFLYELRRRLDASKGPRFTRVPAPAPQDARHTPPAESPGVATADVVLALCSPAYFSEGPADQDWAVLAHRQTLGQARTGTAPRTALPLLWEPVPQRLPEPVAAADVFTAGQPPEYRSLGLALLTMQAPRYRAALDEVLATIVAHMNEAVRSGTTAPALRDRSAGEPPRALAVDDAVFTEEFRKHLAPAVPAPRIPRTLVAGDGTDETVPAELLPELGRRLLLVGPLGAGHSTELARLAGQALDAVPHTAAGADRAPWGCRIPFVLSARSGALPDLDGLVPALAPGAAAREPAGWAARQLRAGHAFVAVDDLDAVPSRNRTAVWESLLRLLRAHPEAPCVIATNGATVPWERLGSEFRTVRLRALAPAGVRALLDTLADGERRLSGALTRRLDEDPVLSGVAGRPAATAAIWRASRAHTPPGPPPRHQLLRAGISAGWRRARPEPGGVPPVREDGAAVPDSVLRTACGSLAVATLDMDGARIPLRTALDALRDRGTRAAGAAPAPDRLLAALADRTGTLYQPGPDTVAFSDPAVRTFLAAHHLAGVEPADAARLLARSGSSELEALLGELRAARDRKEPRGILTDGHRPLRRLPAARPVAPAPARRAVVRSAGELRALTGAGCPELWCEGAVEGLDEMLPHLPGLRTLVLADDPARTALPPLDACPSLRALRVVRCPALTDLSALVSSTVMFLTVDPWPEGPIPEGLYDMPWLSQVDLVSPGARPSARAGAHAAPRPGGVPRQGAVFPGVRVVRPGRARGGNLQH
ncbi:large ATP-binding protein [Streptomyces sp. NBC_00670]|uniref:large ATP-binding protein n=1 Tax=Streptomyces sp. NBC_00670 TaxID=2975804 RepID=UPI002E35F7E3|nr:large ATP-binding protein [Streptomyces sp. NBC_00670]